MSWVDPQALSAQLSSTLAQTDLHLPGVARHYPGKVRDCYVLLDGRRVLVTTDRISAFDEVLGTIPFKGQVLNQLSAFFFEQARGVAPHHLLAVPDPNVSVARECVPVPAEMVMRAYLTGVTSTSIWHAYSLGRRSFCGHRLPEGMKKNEPLPAPILTPSTKAEHGGPDGHDQSVSGDELVRRGLVSEADLAVLTDLCARMFAFGQAHARRRGLILADTKYELGRAMSPDGQGEILFIDEIHTPDSSRYWYAEDYPERLASGEEPRSLDKEYVRRHLTSLGYAGSGAPPPLSDAVRVEAAQRYIKAFELLTGEAFRLVPGSPLGRIARNLEAYLGQGHAG